MEANGLTSKLGSLNNIGESRGCLKKVNTCCVFLLRYLTCMLIHMIFIIVRKDRSFETTYDNNKMAFVLQEIRWYRAGHTFRS
ncbi:hypothetical protein AB205_0178810 [Aquarana catesbeiana]|uniref:Uncharacterized protein n=1 Tax=Aquarana catesbeiana TaxID=8400 RepID=A0A2G9RSA5_AQUCT|nr:hypothetical protein AB205_0178810 [Aquarana catesbeiana]